jgi:hypothetical protein
VLVTFDPQTTNQKTLLAAFRSLPLPAAAPEVLNVPAPAPTAPPPATRPGGGRHARIAMRGLDRHPGLARVIVRHLKSKFNISAMARPLTGHLLVEYDHHRVLFEDLLAEVAHFELPDFPGEDRPTNPLIPSPWSRAWGGFWAACWDWGWSRSAA